MNDRDLIFVRVGILELFSVLCPNWSVLLSDNGAPWHQPFEFSLYKDPLFQKSTTE
jgi:hypothetical protein